MKKTPSNGKKILLLAGESSGDLLGAELVKALKTQESSLSFYGMGSKKMADQGVEIILNSDDLAVVGIVEILTHYREIKNAFAIVKDFINTQKPDLVILIDYPGFNLRMAKFAKEQGCRVLFYVSPQIWIWRYHRIHHIKQYVDRMAVLFLFEKAIYERESIPVDFVGHPIVDQITNIEPNDETYDSLNLDKEKPIIALLPGSRRQEIKRLLPIMVEAANRIQKTQTDAQFIIPIADSVDKSKILTAIEKNPAIQCFSQKTHECLSVADVAVATSGTVTLEVALYNTPFLLVYKTNFLTYLFAKYCLKVKDIGICNIVAEKTIAKELVQSEASAERIAEEALLLLNNADYRHERITSLALVRKNLNANGAALKAAQSVLKLL